MSLIRAEMTIYRLAGVFRVADCGWCQTKGLCLDCWSGCCPVPSDGSARTVVRRAS